MEFKMEKESLSALLNIASRFTSNRLSSVTSLQGVLLEGTKDMLHVYASNLTTFFKATVPVKDLVDFKAIVEPKKLLEFLAFMPPGEVTLNITDKQLTLKKDKTKGNFPLILSDDFVLPPTFPNVAAPLDTSAFLNALPLVLFSASNDDSRPVLTSINFLNTENDFLLISTDGFRLSIVKEKKIGDFPSVLIPADFLQEVVRYMKEAKIVRFNHSDEEKVVMFEVDNYTFYSRVIEGDYPPYERVIPAEVTTTITVDRAELQRSIKLISVFAREFSNVVVCEVTKEGISLRPKKEGNSENTAFVEADVQGEGMPIAFNYKFLLDVVTTMGGKEIVIELLRTDAPAVFKTKEHKGFMHIIMPVRVQE